MFTKIEGERATYKRSVDQAPARAQKGSYPVEEEQDAESAAKRTKMRNPKQQKRLIGGL